ncbi:MAG: hypothetical protein RLY78_95 [Pseudomonadota bacterium]
MRTWTCLCGATLHFHNLNCLACGRSIGYDPRRDRMVSGEPCADPAAARPGAGSALPPDGPDGLRPCAHRSAAPACNWLIAPRDQDGDPAGRCLSCRLTGLAPDQRIDGHDRRWARIERAKRRVLRTLEQLGRSPWDGPATADSRVAAPPLCFHLLAGTPQQAVLTGHADGLVTLNIAETDDVERERRRVAFDEPWRTLQGHLRHELSHWLQWRDLAPDAHATAVIRHHFGDERDDYAQALQRHHTHGAPADWAGRHISPYAASHPWEDWAETCAHYLLIRDTLETAGHWGLRMDDAGTERDFRRRPDEAPDAPRGAGSPDFQALLVERWMPLARLVNALDRSVGLRDPYPFTLSDTVLEKLSVVHALVDRGAPRSEPW